MGMQVRSLIKIKNLDENDIGDHAMEQVALPDPSYEQTKEILIEE